MLNNDTELHVQTVTEGSQNDEKATMAQKVSNVSLSIFCKLVFKRISVDQLIVMMLLVYFVLPHS